MQDPSMPIPALDPVYERKVAPNLVDKLQGTRRLMRKFLAAQCFVHLFLAELALGLALALADWLWILPTWLRVGGLLTMAALGASVVSKRLILSTKKLNPTEAATQVETLFPDLGQRMRTTLDYIDPKPTTTPASPGLVRALRHDTECRTASLDFGVIVPWQRLRGWVVGLAGFAGLWLFLLFASEAWRIAALRLFLVPINYTHLAVQPGDVTCKVGSDLTVEAEITGRAVDHAELFYRPAKSAEDWACLSLALPEMASEKPRPFRGHLETTLKNCQEDLEYRVVAGPVECRIHHVTILHPLVLKSVKATVEPPAYTRRPSQTVKDGNMQVIAGSKVRIQFELDRPPQSAQLVTRLPSSDKSANAKRVAPLKIEGNQLTAELPLVRHETEYEIQAESADGMRLEAPKYRIQIQPDHSPTVRFVKPKEQIEVVPTTEVVMRIEAADDFGLSKLGIVYQVGNGPKKTLYLKQDSNQPVSIKDQAILPLEEHLLGFQDSVTYYAFAEDNHPDQPQRTATDLQFIDIRPFKRDYQLLETGGS